MIILKFFLFLIVEIQCPQSGIRAAKRCMKTGNRLRILQSLDVGVSEMDEMPCRLQMKTIWRE